MPSYKLVLLSMRCFRMSLVSHFIAVHLVCFFLFNAHLFLVLPVIVLSLVLLLELYYHVRLVSFTLLYLVLSLWGALCLRIVVVFALLQRVFYPLLEHEELLLVALAEVELGAHFGSLVLLAVFGFVVVVDDDHA